MITGTHSNGGLGFGVAFTLKDEFSGISDKIQSSFTKLSYKVSVTQKKIDNSIRGIQSGFKGLGLGAAFLAPGILAIREYAKLDDQLTDVRKTTQLTAIEAKEFLNTVKQFDTRTSTSDLLGIGRIGGQMGIAKKDLVSFTKTMNEAVVALGTDFAGGAEEVATKLSILNNIYGVSKQHGVATGLTKIGSAINEISAKGSSTAPFLAQFTALLGGMAPRANISIQKVIGLGAALQELGAAPEESSSAISRMLSVLSTKPAKAAMAIRVPVQEFVDLINTDGNSAMLLFAKRMVELYPKATDFNQAMERAGVRGVRLSKTFGQMADNLDLIKRRQTTVTTAFAEGTSMNTEYMLKNTNLMARIQKATKVFKNLALSIGESLLPVMEQIMPVLARFAQWMTEFSKTPVGGTIIKIAAYVGVAIVGFSLLRIAVNSASLSFFWLRKGMLSAQKLKMVSWLAEVGGSVLRVTKKLVVQGFAWAAIKVQAGLAYGATFARNTIKVLAGLLGITAPLTVQAGLWSTIGVASFVTYGWLIAAITIVIGLIVTSVAKFDQFGKAILLLLGPVGWIVNLFIIVERHVDNIKNAFKDGGFIQGIKAIGLAIIDSILSPIQQLLELIAKIPLIGGIAKLGAEGIAGWRQDLGVAQISDRGSRLEDEIVGAAPKNGGDSSYGILDTIKGMTASMFGGASFPNINVSPQVANEINLKSIIELDGEQLGEAIEMYNKKLDSIQ